MKRLLFLFGIILVSGITGCQEPSNYSMAPGSLEVMVEDDGHFPEFLVGKWMGDKDGWAFIFEPGGTILVARIAMGRTEVKPGKVTTLDTYGGGKAVYIPGDWKVIYSPAYRELTVDIVMNYIKVEIRDKVFQGKTRDLVTGTVSEDGNLWRTVVSSFPEYEGFPMDPNDLPVTNDVVFTKIKEGK